MKRFSVLVLSLVMALTMSFGAAPLLSNEAYAADDDTITLTIHASSREGDDFGTPIVINNVPKGSTYDQALAMIGETIGSVYINPGAGYQYSAAWNLKHPFSTYGTENDAMNDRFKGNEVLNEDTDSYIPYRKDVPVELTLTPPVCGTNTSTPLSFSFPDNAKWLYGVAHQQWWQYSGDFVGGNTYEYYIVIDLNWGYYSTSTSKATVNGGEFSGVQMYGTTRFGFRVKVKAEHDPGDPEVTDVKEPTCTEAGSHHEKTLCKGCGEVVFDGTVEDPATGHKYGAWKKLDANQHQRVCEHDAAHIEKENHKWDSGKVTKQPTTKATGVRTYTCTECKATKTETIAKLKSTAKKVVAAKGIASGSKAVNISWNNVKADRYVVYLGKCNASKSDYSCKKIGAVSGKTFKLKKKGLSKKTAYKFYVVAQKKVNGKYKTIARSKVGHFITGNASAKFTNPKALKLKKASVTVAKGKSVTIKAAVAKVKKSKRLLTGHAKKLRFTSSDPAVASVNAKGKVTGKKSGTCTIYVQTINGIWKTCKVTVK